MNIRDTTALVPRRSRRGLAAAAVAASVSIGLAHAGEKAVPQQVLERLLNGQGPDTVHRLPTAGGITAVEAGGNLYILSANGRFLLDGTLRDLWHNGRVLDSSADIERYALRLDLDALEIDFAKLVTVYLGAGSHQVTVFVSPGCPACAKALDALAAMGDRYTARVVVVPRRDAVAAVRRIDCAAAPGRRRALLLGANMPDGTAPSPAVCPGTRARITSTLLTARVIGVDRVPFVIAPDGRISKGLPRQTTLAAFLAGSE